VPNIDHRPSRNAIVDPAMAAMSDERGWGRGSADGVAAWRGVAASAWAHDTSAGRARARCDGRPRCPIFFSRVPRRSGLRALP